MLENAGLVGLVAGALLFAAVAAWLKMGRGPLLRRLNGDVAIDKEQPEKASRLLVLALGVSAVAAVLAISALMFD